MVTCYQIFSVFMNSNNINNIPVPLKGCCPHSIEESRLQPMSKATGLRRCYIRKLWKSRTIVVWKQKGCGSSSEQHEQITYTFIKSTDFVRNIHQNSEGLKNTYPHILVLRSNINCSRRRSGGQAPRPQPPTHLSSTLRTRSTCVKPFI